MRKFLVFMVLMISMLLTSCEVKYGKNICAEVEGYPASPMIAVIGDSILAFSHKNCYTVAGLLSQFVAENIPNYAHDGARLKNEGTTKRALRSLDIYGQFDKALTKNPALQIVVLNGGGLDIIIDSICTPWPNNKDIIDETIENLRLLFVKMRAAGIVYITYIGYYHPIGIFNSLKESTDYAMDKVAIMCAAENVYFIDMRTDFDNHKKYYWIDGLHPSAKGTKAIADKVTYAKDLRNMKKK
jgi:lysophospholipase L1-like esterase